MPFQKSDTIGKLSEALAKAQGMFGPLKRGRTVDYTLKSGQKIKYSYAELADVLDVIRKPLSENSLAIMQPASFADGKVTVTTLLAHVSGEWISDDLDMECPGKSPQEEGSALTYARRYGLSSLIGIASEDDDDGATAQHGHEAKKASAPHQEAQQTTVQPPNDQTDEYWCKEHNAKWFKAGAMKGYAHKILGTDKWCNMPVKQVTQDPVEDLFPESQPKPYTGPTTIKQLVEMAHEQYGLAPSDVAKEAAVESTARITDVPRVWTQIVAKYPKKEASLA